MGILKSVDWQMVSFVSVTLLQEYFRLPQIYYWSAEKKTGKANLTEEQQLNPNDEDHHKAA